MSAPTLSPDTLHRFDALIRCLRTAHAAKADGLPPCPVHARTLRERQADLDRAAHLDGWDGERSALAWVAKRLPQTTGERAAMVLALPSERRDYRSSEAYRRSCRVGADGGNLFPLRMGAPS